MSLWQLSWDIVIQSVRRSQNSNFGNKLTASIRRPLMPAQSTVARPFRRKYFWNRPEASERRFQGRYQRLSRFDVLKNPGRAVPQLDGRDWLRFSPALILCPFSG